MVSSWNKPYVQWRLRNAYQMETRPIGVLFNPLSICNCNNILREKMVRCFSILENVSELTQQEDIRSNKIPETGFVLMNINTSTSSKAGITVVETF